MCARLQWILDSPVLRAPARSPWKATQGHRAVAVPELPLDGSLCELRAAPGTAPTLNQAPPRPLNKGTGNPDGVFNFDKKHSTFSPKITYEERDRWKDV